MRQIPGARKWTRNRFYDILYYTAVTTCQVSGILLFGVLIVRISNLYQVDRPRMLEEQRIKDAALIREQQEKYESERGMGTAV